MFARHIRTATLMIAGLAAIALVSSDLSRIVLAQNDSDEYGRREDQFDLRDEGIKPEARIDVSADRIALLSARAMTGTIPTTEAPTLHLSIYTTTRTPAEVSISHDRKHYYVDPIRDDWGPGFDTFTWPTTIMRRNIISVDELFARAVHLERGTRTLFPASLYSGDAIGEVSGYTFVVAALRKMRLQWWILDAHTEEAITSSQPRAVEANDPFYLTWQCRGELAAAHDGEYILKLEGKYRPRVGREKTISVSYRFYHKSDLSK